MFKNSFMGLCNSHDKKDWLLVWKEKLTRKSQLISWPINPPQPPPYKGLKAKYRLNIKDTGNVLEHNFKASNLVTISELDLGSC